MLNSLSLASALNLLVELVTQCGAQGGAIVFWVQENLMLKGELRERERVMREGKMS